MNQDALKAAVIAIASQTIALAVGYGLINNQDVGNWTALSMAVINAAFLIAHGLHAKAAQKRAPVVAKADQVTVNPK